MARKTLIIGAGIIGAASAYSLQKAGADVTVLDAGGANATTASFGWINASFYLDRDHFNLRSDSIEAYQDLASELSLPLDWCGCLCWEETGAAFDAQRDELIDLGYEVEVIERAEFTALEPHIAHPPERCLMFRREAAVDAGVLAEKLLQAACDLGARVISGVRVEAILQTSGRVTGVRTSAGDMEADQVLVAAGTATQDLMATVGIDVPMLTRPALMLRTKPVEQILSHVLVSQLGELRQLNDGSLLMPAAIAHQRDDAETLSDTPEAIADDALRRLQDAIPSIALSWSHAGLAYRPVPQDNLPVAGFAAEGLYVAVMHSGITLGALMGQLIAAEMTGGPTNETAQRLAPYRPDRFAGH